MAEQTPQDAGQEFDRYMETGEVQPDPPAATLPTNNASSYPELILTEIAPRIETITAQDGEIYELRLRHHYPLGIQSGLINAYNTVLAFMDRESGEFEFIDDSIPDPVAALDGADPSPDGAGGAESPQGDGILSPLPIVPPAPSGPLTAIEQKQRRFLLDKIAKYAIPDAPESVRKGMTVDMLETLAIRFFVRSRAAQEEAAQTGNRPTSGG